MLPDPADQSGRPASPDASAPKQPSLPTEASQRPNVPTFRCLVYVARQESGGVKARVANLPGIECSVASERDAMAKIVPMFKQRVAQYLEADETIPWIDPPEPLQPGEQKRLLPVHL